MIRGWLAVAVLCCTWWEYVAGITELNTTAQETNCMTRLVRLSGVRNYDTIVEIFTAEQMDQELFYLVPSFADAATLMSLLGVDDPVEQFRLYTCLNKAASTGDRCSVETPCGHGVCTHAEGRYRCCCDAGYTGSECREELNECELKRPCQNGGTCHDHVNNFTCTCAEGFYGLHCETDRNECASQPCRHGTCVDGVNGFKCLCFTGYTGRLCREDINDCASNPCLNNGRCVDHLNRYTCQCRPGFKGYTCKINVNECASHPCQNKATCEDLANAYHCHCTIGYEGDNCETRWLTLKRIEDLEHTVYSNLANGSQLRQTIAELKETVSRGGQVYVHWGQDECPDSADLVYNGTVTGPSAQETGNGANFLCLAQPVYNNATTFPSGGKLQVSIYKTRNSPYQRFEDNGIATCAVCRTQVRSSVMMIPGTSVCPNGWHSEYFGYLMSGHSTSRRSEYLCFDEVLENAGISKSRYSLRYRSVSASTLYHVAIQDVSGFSTLKNGAPVTCVVCSM